MESTTGASQKRRYNSCDVLLTPLGFESMKDWVIILLIMQLFSAGWFVLALAHFRWERQLSVLRACVFALLADIIMSFLGFFLSEMTLTLSDRARFVIGLSWFACPYVCLAAWGFQRLIRRRQVDR